MNDLDFEINIIDDEELPIQTPPLKKGKYFTWGKPEQAGVRVICRQKVFREIEKHAQAHSEEIGGILLGKAYRFEGEIYAEIQEYLPAKVGFHNGVGHFNFSEETWADLLRRKDTSFDSSTIVGWFHSHPGHGIFLSQGMDTQIQGYFSKPFQVAMVYDPKHHHGGFFSWQGAVSPLGSGFYELFDPGNKQPYVTWKNWKKEPPVKRTAFMPVWAAITLFVLLLILFVSGWAVLEQRIALLSQIDSRQDGEALMWQDRLEALELEKERLQTDLAATAQEQDTSLAVERARIDQIVTQMPLLQTEKADIQARLTAIEQEQFALRATFQALNAQVSTHESYHPTETPTPTATLVEETPTTSSQPSPSVTPGS